MTDNQTKSEKLSPLQQNLLKRWQGARPLIIPEAFYKSLQQEFSGKLKFNEPLKNHSWIKIGGPADIFAQPKNIEELACLLKLVGVYQVPLTIIGDGANILFRDGGVRGVVLNLLLYQIEIIEVQDSYLEVYAEAGVPFVKLVHLVRDAGFADLAPMAGIPGTVGGLLAMNAGVPSREMKDVTREVSFLGAESNILKVPCEKLVFSYRHLRVPQNQVIVSGLFRFVDRVAPEEAQNLYKRTLEQRAQKQPVAEPNLGSIFKNPIAKKCTAGQLIESAGLKGVRVGYARVSLQHANFIVNEGGASSKDVELLIALIIDRVKQTQGASLELEIKIMGEDVKDEK